MTRTIFMAAALALAVTLPIAPAQATGAPRTFVSTAGSDSNNCTNVATPCRHLAAAYAATAANGEIYVLDPANYGSLTITGPVSIEGHGWASIAPVSGQPGNHHQCAGATDKINIIGVVLDGTNLAVTNGIQFNSGGSLTVRDSVIRNFSKTASTSCRTFDPSQLFVSNTLISDNGGMESRLIPPVRELRTAFSTTSRLKTMATVDYPSTSTQTINLTVSDSVSANNGNSGIIADSAGGPLVSLMVRNSTIANNGASGLEAFGPSTVIRVTRSTITGNATGWDRTSGDVVLSYGDNNIDGNGTANTEPPNPLTYK